MKNKKLEIIHCPKCDAEYLPSEIFLPDIFLGKTNPVIKDENGKIIDFAGKSMDLHENYTCDYCNTTFKIRTQIQFFTEINNTENFSEDYVTKLTKLTLNEE